jgi:hypothetical protein
MQAGEEYSVGLSLSSSGMVGLRSCRMRPEVADIGNSGARHLMSRARRIHHHF